MTIPDIDLLDGTTIPQFGLGVWQVPDAEAQALVETAVELGYRHIDTAQMYGNEAGVGAAVQTLDRDQVYVTTKLNNNRHDPAEAKASLARSLETMGLEYVDLFLIHWPLEAVYGDGYLAVWQALIELRAEGLTRSIGVSNFQPHHLASVIDATGVTPVVNQIEVHPYFANAEAVAATVAVGAQVEAWSPLGQDSGVLVDPVLVALAETYGKTTAQIALRWQIDQGNIVFPKSSSRQRLAENLDIFDFSLTTDDIAQINALDRGAAGRQGPDPDTFDWIPGR